MCKLCTSTVFSTADKISNRKKITIKLKDFGDCSSEGVYAATCCNKHDSIYVGHTGVALRSRFDRHRHDIKNRPGNSELTEHFRRKNHRESDMEVSTLQTGITDEKHRESLEDRCICRLQTLKKNKNSTCRRCYTGGNAQWRSRRGGGRGVPKGPKCLTVPRPKKSEKNSFNPSFWSIKIPC